MKIVLPKTIAEPLTISWEMIFPHEGMMSVLIQQSLSDHMRYRRKISYIFSDNRIVGYGGILECLRVIVRRGGGRFPVATHERTGTDDLFTVNYQINRKCYKYSVLLSPKRVLT
jgi:hypothetical protein